MNPPRTCAYPGCTHVTGKRDTLCFGHAKQRAHREPLRPLRVVDLWTKEETALAQQKREQGETYADISSMLGRSIWSVKNHLSDLRTRRQSKAREGSIFVREATPYPGVARCKCGLSLPCNDCIGSIIEIASSRRGDSTGLTT